MTTQEYRTKTIYQPSKNYIANSKYWGIGLDIGYSSVKIYSGNAIGCFPAFATKTNADINAFSTISNSSIYYRNENGETWCVGATAQNSISTTDTTAGSSSIFGRQRYYDPMFLVIARVGIAMGYRQNMFGDPKGREIALQTGLPPKFIKSDAKVLKSVLTGNHKFSIKVGNHDWEYFDFSIFDKNIGIMDQPMGTLISVATDKNMQMINGAEKYLLSKTLIIDPGFGTLDIYPVINNEINRDNCQTFSNLGMKQVLKETAEDIFNKYNFEIPIPAMQQFLERGKVIKREGLKCSYVPFDDILEEHSKDVCENAIQKILEIYNPPIEYDYMIITGGTGAAWDNYIRNNEYFIDANTLKIISGNAGNTGLMTIFSNVRGYYISQFMKINNVFA